MTEQTEIAWADEDNGDPVVYVGTVVEPSANEQADHENAIRRLPGLATLTVFVQHPKGWRRWVDPRDLRALP